MEGFRVLAAVVMSVVLMIQKGHGFEYKVGGSNGWTVPADANAAAVYNQWAEKNRFQIGDTLLFVYNGDQDSVLHVTKDDYTNCNTASPLNKFTDGHTVYKFDQSGPHYFISGVAEHCRKNEKLVVVVMADRTHLSSNGTAPASSPPSPPPAGESPPSPAPSGESSPPSPSEESSPPSSQSAPAPSDESSHPKNGAASVVLSVFGTAAVFVGSLVVAAV